MSTSPYKWCKWIKIYKISYSKSTDSNRTPPTLHIYVHDSFFRESILCFPCYFVYDYLLRTYFNEINSLAVKGSRAVAVKISAVSPGFVIFEKVAVAPGRRSINEMLAASPTGGASAVIKKYRALLKYSLRNQRKMKLK